MDIQEFAQKYIEAETQAFKEGNFDAIEAIVAPDVVYHWGAGRDMVGHEAHKQDIMSYRQRTSKHTQEWEYITGDGNVFSLSYKSRGLFTGEIPGMPPPTGKEVTSDYLFVFRLENGKIVEAWARGSTTGLD